MLVTIRRPKMLRPALVHAFRPALPADINALGGDYPAAQRPVRERAPRSTESVTDFVAVQRTKVYSATRFSERIVIDGVVDEPSWDRAAVGSDFYQTDPQSGVPATERTEFRILYDEDQIYVSIVAYQRDPIPHQRAEARICTDRWGTWSSCSSTPSTMTGTVSRSRRIPASAMRDWQISARGSE